MKDAITERVKSVAAYIIENKCTVRSAAKKFGISKSTVHKDITDRLGYIDSSLFLEIKTLMQMNKSVRHIRGGEATRQKYAELHKNT
ncbi:MAG: sporulation transcriptional regulator SpoIIID [Clostridia bacterium]|nr:sporulation transcriptional regulator SpoIIID [Clostridia bacterium]